MTELAVSPARATHNPHLSVVVPHFSLEIHLAKEPRFDLRLTIKKPRQPVSLKFDAIPAPLRPSVERELTEIKLLSSELKDGSKLFHAVRSLVQRLRKGILAGTFTSPRSRQLVANTENWLVQLADRCRDSGFLAYELLPKALTSAATRLKDQSALEPKRLRVPLSISAATILAWAITDQSRTIQPWQFRIVRDKWEGIMPNGVSFLHQALSDALHASASRLGLQQPTVPEGFAALLKQLHKRGVLPRRLGPLTSQKDLRTALYRVVTEHPDYRKVHCYVRSHNLQSKILTERFQTKRAPQYRGSADLPTLIERATRDGPGFLYDRGCPRLTGADANKLATELNARSIPVEPWRFLYIVRKWKQKDQHDFPYALSAYRSALYKAVTTHKLGDITQPRRFRRLLAAHNEEFILSGLTSPRERSQTIQAITSLGGFARALCQLVKLDPTFSAIKRLGVRPSDLKERPQNYWTTPDGKPTKDAIVEFERVFDAIAKRRRISDPNSAAGLQRMAKYLSVRNIRQTKISHWGATGSMVIKAFRDSPAQALAALIQARPKRFVGVSLQAHDLCNPPKGTWGRAGKPSELTLQLIRESLAIISQTHGIELNSVAGLRELLPHLPRRGFKETRDKPNLPFARPYRVFFKHRPVKLLEAMVEHLPEFAFVREHLIELKADFSPARIGKPINPNQNDTPSR